MEKHIEIVNEVKKIIKGKDDAVNKVLAAILAGGHVLLEDVPGVGKTSLAMAFAKAMSLKHKRIQFTPDVLPSDITGFSMYNKSTGKFEYREGAAICNLLLADEINRTSPKTQSALLEVMEEGRVTVDGAVYEVKKPFTVIATQNPIGFMGTQQLPESQLDRFMIKLSMGYPDKESEIDILKGKSLEEPLNDVKSIASAEEIIAMQKSVREIHVEDSLYEYLTELAAITRNHEEIELGISIRGSKALLNIAKSQAYMSGRDYLIPEDIQEVFPLVAVHRLILTSKARFKGRTAHNIALEVLNKAGLIAIR